MCVNAFFNVHDTLYVVYTWYYREHWLSIMLQSATRISDCYTILQGEEMFYLTTHSAHFIYGYIASHIW